MAFKHYDVVRAASPSDLAEKLTHKLKEGWQPFGSPVAITPYTDGALITGLTFLDPKDATRVQGFFQHLQVRFGDGPWQDVKGLDEVGSDTGRTGE